MAPLAGPRIFRVLIGARDLRRSRRYFERVLGVRGRMVAPGRLYLDCGPVILGILDRSSSPPEEWSPPTEAIYFATEELDRVYRRAARIGGLVTDTLHGDPSQPMGEIRLRPWGERSFYASDPSGNPICFVDAETLFTGLTRGPSKRTGPAGGQRTRARGSRPGARHRST